MKEKFRFIAKNIQLCDNLHDIDDVMVEWFK